MNTINLTTLYEQYTQTLKEGDFINGTLAMRTNPSGQEPGVGYVEIPGCSDGVVPIEELKDVEVGDHIFALVIDPENEEGCPVLSIRRAQREAQWRKIGDALKDKSAVTARVTRVVKGGVTVDVFGQTGFMPASQIDLRRVEELGEWRDQEVEVLVIEADRRRRNLVVSRRKLLEQEQANLISEQLHALEEGATYEASITAIAPFGAFCSLSEGLTGLIHASEMKWGRWDYNDPGVEVGQVLPVKLLGASVKDGKPRISLSVRLTQERPKRRRNKRGGKR
jgi:small subunit ribosomal protein S1